MLEPPGISASVKSRSILYLLMVDCAWPRSNWRLVIPETFPWPFILDDVLLESLFYSLGPIANWVRPGTRLIILSRCQRLATSHTSKSAFFLFLFSGNGNNSLMSNIQKIYIKVTDFAVTCNVKSKEMVTIEYSDWGTTGKLTYLT